jgi:polysaccharide lyase-like protein
MSTTVTTTAPGLGRKLVLGLACCALAACTSSGSPSTSNGGSNGTGVGGTGAPAGPGGSPGAGGSATGLGGSNVGAGGSGADNGFGGSGATGAITGTGGTTPVTGDAGTSGTGLGGSGAVGAGGTTGGGGGSPGGGAGCPAGATFCDDFEASTTLGSAWTMDNTLNGTIGVVSTFTTTPGPTMAHSGKNAVKITVPTGSGYAMIVTKMGVPTPPSTTGYWARAWIYFETAASDAGHCVMIEGSTGMAADLQNHGARPLNTTRGNMEINIDPVGGGEASSAATMPLPHGAWTCFEWNITATGGTGDISLYAGTTAMAPLVATLKNNPIQALTENRIGYERYGSGGAGNLWIDDYAIGPTRLGCN